MYRIPPARFPPAVPDPSPPWAEQEGPSPMAQLPSLHQHKGFWLLPTPARSGACVPLLDGTRRRLSAQHSPCNPVRRAPQHPLHTQQVSEGSQRDVEKYGVIWEVLLRPPGEMCPPQEITEGERGLEAFKSLICVSVFLLHASVCDCCTRGSWEFVCVQTQQQSRKICGGTIYKLQLTHIAEQIA